MVRGCESILSFCGFFFFVKKERNLLRTIEKQGYSKISLTVHPLGF